MGKSEEDCLVEAIGNKEEDVRLLLFTSCEFGNNDFLPLSAMFCLSEKKKVLDLVEAIKFASRKKKKCCC